MKIFGQRKWLRISLTLAGALTFYFFFLQTVTGRKVSTIESRLHRELAYQSAYQKIKEIKKMDFEDISLGSWKPEKKTIEEIPVYQIVKIEEKEKNLKKINVEVVWKEAEINVLIKVDTLISKYR